MRRILFHCMGLLVIGLSACAQPRTMPPLATAEEVSREKLHHHQFLRESRAAGHVVGGKNRKSPRPRVESVAQRIAPAAIALCREMQITDPDGCAYSIHIVRGAEDNPNAYTDGEDIYITSSMVRHTQTDDELALVLAHEFAHNMMQHHAGVLRNMLIGAVVGAAADASLGYNDGTGGVLGAEAGALAYSPSYEHEADYIAMYIIARAGYDYGEATGFWRTISLTLPDSVYFSYTHPTNPERFVVLQKTASEIDVKNAKDIPLIPTLRETLTAQKGT